MISSQHDDLIGEAGLECEEKTDDLATLLTSVYVITEEQISKIPAQNLILLVLLILVGHFFKHMKQIAVLAVNITEYLDWGLKLQQRFFIFEYFLYLLEQKVDNLLRQIDERHIFGILAFIVNNLVVEVVDNDVHNELHLIYHISF